MAKKMRARTGGKPSGRIAHAAARVRLPKIAWELGVLFVLLLVVFAPNLVRLLGAIAPLIPAPQPAFVYPLQIASSSYKLTTAVGMSFEAMNSSSYQAAILTGGFSEKMNSSSYVLQLGVAGFVIVPSAMPFGPVYWGNESALPASPTTYNASETYYFTIKWTGSPSDVSFELEKNGVSLPSRFYSAGQIVRDGEYYTATIPSLAAGTYNYTWAAFHDSSIANKTPETVYSITKTTSTMGLLIDGAASGKIVSRGTVVQISANSIANPSLPVELRADFNGTLVKIADGVGSISYILDTASINGGTYMINAVIAGTESWSANSSALMLTIADVNLSNPQVSPAGAAYAPRTYTFSTACDGFISSVLLELDGENRTASNVAGYCSSVLSNLNAGSHAYRWWANDTAGKWYTSGIYNYEITKANVTLDLLIDGQSASKIANVGDDPNITITMDVPGLRKLTILDPTGTPKEPGWARWTSDVTTSFSALGLSLGIGRWQIGAVFDGDTNYNPANITRWIAVGMTDSTAPQFTNVVQTTDSPAYGDSVIVSADWSDDVLVNYIWLETDAINGSYTYIGASAGSSSFTITAMVPPGTVVSWRIWANDTSGNLSSTSIKNFTVAGDTSSPTIANQNQSKDIIGSGDPINLSSQCNDNALLREAWLATNESGTFSNVTRIDLSGKSAKANFAVSSSIGASQPIGFEKIIGWKIYCIDYSGNAVETPAMAFKIKKFDEFDANKDGVIQVGELTSAVNKWKRGEYGMMPLVILIGRWKAGVY